MWVQWRNGIRDFLQFLIQDPFEAINHTVADKSIAQPLMSSFPQLLSSKFLLSPHDVAIKLKLEKCRITFKSN
jgi:hypothetical protein